MLPAAVALAPYALGLGNLLHGKHRPNYSQAYDWFRGLNVQGYTTPEDEAAAEATRNRLSSAATESAKGLRLAASRRLEARGLAGSPATEAIYGRIGEEEAAGREAAAGAASQQLYDTRMGREAFNRQGALQAFGAKLGQAYGDQARNDLRSSVYMNSLLDYTPRILDWLDRGKKPGAVNEGQPGEAWG